MHATRTRLRPVRTRCSLVPLGSVVVVDGRQVRVSARTEDAECVAFEAVTR